MTIKLTNALQAIDRIHAEGPFEAKDARQRGRDVAEVKHGLQQAELTINRLAQRLEAAGIDPLKYIDQA